MVIFQPLNERCRLGTQFWDDWELWARPGRSWQAKDLGVPLRIVSNRVERLTPDCLRVGGGGKTT